MTAAVMALRDSFPYQLAYQLSDKGLSDSQPSSKIMGFLGKTWIEAHVVRNSYQSLGKISILACSSCFVEDFTYIGPNMLKPVLKLCVQYNLENLRLMLPVVGQGQHLPAFQTPFRDSIGYYYNHSELMWRRRSDCIAEQDVKSVMMEVLEPKRLSECRESGVSVTWHTIHRFLRK